MWGDVNVVDRGDRRRQRLSAVRLTEGEKRHSLYVAILFLSFRLFAYAKIHLPRQREAQSVDKPKILFLRRSRRIFRFSADMRGGKTHYKRKTAE